MFAVLAIGILPEWMHAQSPPDQIVPVAYSPPQRGAKRFKVDRIEGQAVFIPAPKRWVGVESALRFALFDEKHTLLSSAVPGESGQFKIADVAPGAYTLVVEADKFHRLSIPLQVTAATSQSVPAGPALQLTMRLKTDKRQSLVTPITNKALRTELMERVQKDQNIRYEWLKQGADHPDNEITVRMTAIGVENLVRLKEIVHQYGWPGPALIGRDGSAALFILLQHSPHATQKEMLPLMWRAYRSDKVPGQSYALLLDRVLIGDGKPQVYGTQTRPLAEWHNKEPTFFPIADEMHVDQRRAQIGLFPLSAYITMLKETYFPAKKEKQ